MHAAQVHHGEQRTRSQASVTVDSRRRTGQSILAMLAREIRPVDIMRVPIDGRRVISQRDAVGLEETVRVSRAGAKTLGDVRDQVDVQLRVLERRRRVDLVPAGDERRGARLVCELAKPGVHPVAVDLVSGVGVRVRVGLRLRLRARLRVRARRRRSDLVTGRVKVRVGVRVRVRVTRCRSRP